MIDLHLVCLFLCDSLSHSAIIAICVGQKIFFCTRTTGKTKEKNTRPSTGFCRLGTTKRMYIPIERLAVGYALLSTASAFYPYERTSGDPTTTSSSSSRRNALPLPNLHPVPRSSSSTGSRSITLPLPLYRGSLGARDNTYDIINGNDPKQKNSVAVDQDKNDISYMAAVKIGDSQEEYKLLLDSAASNTWVMSEDCTTEACGKHNLFGKSDSKTIKVRVLPYLT